MKFRCPRCRMEIVYSAENPHRPFCSARCREADLGAWFSEQNAIPGEKVDPVELAAKGTKTTNEDGDPIH